MRSAFSITIRLAFGTSTPTSMTVVATSRSILPSLKRAMTASFSRGGHAAVHEPDRQFRQRFRERRGGLFGRLRVQLIGLLDQRAHPVGLALLPARIANAHDDFVASILGQRDRLHRRAAGRQLVDDRNVEIGVRGHRQRSRNRRRGHDQLMRIATGGQALLAQQQALVHAEAMLLVDDHQAEPLELDAFLKQRVRADRDLRLRPTRGPPARACAPPRCACR